jgi:hypothetical protein
LQVGGWGLKAGGGWGLRVGGRGQSCELGAGVGIGGLRIGGWGLVVGD